MSKRAPAVSVLTANRLTDGIAVFLAADGTWVESIEGAAIARTAEEAGALQAQGVHDAARNLVVEPYLAELAQSGARPVPTRMRERVRVEGPSILADVPGYVPPGAAGTPSPRASPTSQRAPSARGEGRGEGQPRAQTSHGLDRSGRHAPMSVQAPAPHPDPLSARAGRGDPVGAPVEA
jgi:hypothetical protein